MSYRKVCHFFLLTAHPRGPRQLKPSGFNCRPINTLRPPFCTVALLVVRRGQAPSRPMSSDRSIPLPYSLHTIAHVMRQGGSPVVYRPRYPCSHCGQWLRITDAREHARRFFLPAGPWRQAVDGVQLDPRPLLGLFSLLISSLHLSLHPSLPLFRLASISFFFSRLFGPGWDSRHQQWGPPPEPPVASAYISPRKRHRADAHAWPLGAPGLLPSVTIASSGHSGNLNLSFASTYRHLFFITLLAIDSSARLMCQMRRPCTPP